MIKETIGKLECTITIIRIISWKSKECKDISGKQKHKRVWITAPCIVLHNHPYISSCSRYISKPGLQLLLLGWLCRCCNQQLFVYFVCHYHPYVLLIHLVLNSLLLEHCLSCRCFPIFHGAEICPYACKPSFYGTLKPVYVISKLEAI